jgi:type IV pilus assembly protein PilF
MVRLRTLEEILDSFETEDDQSSPDATASFIVRVKGRNVAAAPLVLPPQEQIAATHQAEEPESATEGVYLSDGKLNVPFLLQNAELLVMAGDHALAKNIYSTLRASGEKTAVALFGLGRCAQLEGKLEEARALFEESIAYHPTLDSYRQLALLLIELKKDLLAAEVLESALALRELSNELRFELHKAAGNCWARAGREARNAANAERHYRNAIEIAPDADEIRTNLGTVCLLTGKASEAKRHFQDAIASNPRNYKALSGMGAASLLEGDKRAAHDFFARSLEIELNDANAVFHLIKCAYELKSYATAARVVEEYIQVAPINANLLYSLAGLQFHLGRMNSARETVEKTLQLAPDHSGARDLKGLLKRTAGEI